jgi:transcriptional regulator with XRE-family HTH domain
MTTSDASSVPTAADIGRRLAAERERLGMSLCDVGRRLGIDHSTYATMERGRDVRASTLVRLAMIGYDLRKIIPEAFGAGGRKRRLSDG